MAELCSTACITTDVIPSLRPCKGRFITGSIYALIIFKCNMGFNQTVDLGGGSDVLLGDFDDITAWEDAADNGLIKYYTGVGTFPEPEETTTKAVAGSPEVPSKWTYNFEFLINRFSTTNTGDVAYAFGDEVAEITEVRKLANYEAYTVGFVLPDKETVVLSDEAVAGGTQNPGFKYVGTPNVVYGEDDTSVVAIKIKGGFDYLQSSLKTFYMPGLLTAIAG